MSIQGIPVVGIGPGSQPVEEDGARLEYIALPNDMSTFQRPDIPEPEAVQHLLGAKQAMHWLQDALNHYNVGSAAVAADITRLDTDSRELINQMLGEGEVSLKYEGKFRSRSQESVLAGVWRTFYLDGEDQVIHDLIEVCDVPALVRLPGKHEPVSLAKLTDAKAPPQVMNAMPILTELQDQRESFQPGQVAHVINLTLLPLSEEDTLFLDERLGRGPVDILSRGYGSCRVISTAMPNIWWVRYYNSMGTLILNTLEVVDVPLVACAAQDDIEDSAHRLKEILEPYWADVR
jgi:hydrogenase-1 operon protein HyaF